MRRHPDHVPGSQTDALGLRALAFVADTLFVIVLLVVMVLLPAFVFWVGESIVGATGISVNAGLAEAVTALFGLVVLAWWFFVPFAGLLYKIGFEAWLGYTPGKGILNLVVVDTDGQPIGWSEAIGRNLVFIALLLVWIGPVVSAIVALFDEDHQRIGDSVVETVVARWD